MANPAIYMVYVFRNGMVMTVDHAGQQIGQYNGRWLELRDQILDDCPPNTVVVFNSDWPPTLTRKLF